MPVKSIILERHFVFYPGKNAANAYNNITPNNHKSENQDKRWYELSDFRKINDVLVHSEFIYQKKISASKTK